MKNEIGSHAFEYLLKKLFFSCKPGKWDEIIELSEAMKGLEEEIYDECFESLPKYKAEELGIMNPLDDFHNTSRLVDVFEGFPKIFLLNVGSEWFLVDTEGSSYCRYIIKL